MDENINEVENVEGIEDFEADVATEESNGIGLVGKIVGGVAVAGVGAGIGYVVKNRAKLVEAHKVRKEARQEARKARKIEKCLKELEALGFGEETTEEK